MSVPAPILPADAESGGRPPLIRADSLPAAAPIKTAKLKWIDVFETGHAEIDTPHRTLFQHCDRLMTLVVDAAAWPQIVAEARKLATDCIAHFRIEEDLLRHTGFPRLDYHVSAHRRMEQEMQRLIAGVELADGSRDEHRALAASLGPATIDLMVRYDLDYCSHLLHLRGR